MAMFVHKKLSEVFISWFYIEKRKNKQKCHLSKYLLKLGKKLQLTLYEHEYVNFNFFTKVFEYKGFK